MIWNKKGLIFENAGLHPKLFSHASNPLAIQLDDNIYRVFYSGRDAENRSSVSYFDYDFESMKIVFECNQPLISHGSENTFYSHGISIGNYYEVDGNKYLNFMGWQIPENEHWRGKIGRLLISGDLDQLTIDSKYPLLDTDTEDPISLSYPWIHYKEGIYQMWYGSTVYWDTETEEMLHIIKYAESSNADTWVRKGEAIPFILGKSQAFSRPSVIQNESGYHMWFSYRGKLKSKYRIGYAFSADGIKWECDYENIGIDISETGWDNDMICYPFVFVRENSLYMLYNGNDYGKTGIGLAVLNGLSLQNGC